MGRKNLRQIVAEHPFPEYTHWWPIGQQFLRFMSEAIVSPWSELCHNEGDIRMVKTYFSDYLRVVYGKETNESLVDEFIANSLSLSPIQSGEFDALSYAFYRSAFELIEKHSKDYCHPLERERRLFTKRVGRKFFSQMRDHLDLKLPAGLDNEQDFNTLKACIQHVGTFLREQRYCRDYFDFRFTLEVEIDGSQVAQSDSDFLDNLKRNGIAYAIYEMGYPVILPSAVYLYHTIGEAQHHSSRTIEELFALVGHEAREIPDFDPSEYPPDRVVELWRIKDVSR
ncbi:MAG: hypothetical protein ACFFER_08445 [Candidatus Thorarchaeota archaeon]